MTKSELGTTYKAATYIPVSKSKNGTDTLIRGNEVNPDGSNLAKYVHFWLKNTYMAASVGERHDSLLKAAVSLVGYGIPGQLLLPALQIIHSQHPTENGRPKYGDGELAIIINSAKSYIGGKTHVYMETKAKGILDRWKSKHKINIRRM